MLLNFNDYIKEENVYLNINLKNEYAKYNKLLFDNELLDIPLNWDKSKKHAGVVKYKTETINRKIYNSDIKLFISTFFEKSYQDVINILIHEMIHVYLAQNNINDTSMHGVKYMKKLEEINNQGYNIPLSENVEDMNVKDIKNTEYFIVLMEDNFNNTIKKSVGVYKKELNTDDNINAIIKMLERVKKFNVKLNYKLDFMLSNNNNLNKYKIKRTFNTFETFIISDDYYSELLKTSDLIKHIEI